MLCCSKVLDPKFNLILERFLVYIEAHTGRGFLERPQVVLDNTDVELKFNML